MASPSAVSEDRKSDDLEIVSVGDLYSGSCAKKEKIVSLILWAIKLFELTMGAHIIWRLKKVLKAESYSIDADTPDTNSGKLMGVVDSFSVNSNSALILWKIVSCAALRTSKRGMAVATHAELLAAEGTSVMKENVTHETSQKNRCHMQLMPIL
ncbi:hypothetical protein HID58_086481 [Brassica napus]|uniref:Uncharacterized protein n=1 Tax=Brassica napus TaxID=3708 RepID=A0ABQ7XQL3_BRANA|nr:hypothetical protein HID58_086481 [Brassica napus]